MKDNRFIFLLTGSFTLFVSIYTIFTSISLKRFPDSLMLVGMTIMMFCLAYLAPHFAEKDERAQKIRERGIYMSYFWSMGFALILVLLLGPSTSIDLTGYQAILIFITFYVSIVFLNMVYYAIKY